MDFKKVTAIIRCNILDKVEGKLQEIGVKGVSITEIKGYGEYADTYTKDWLVCHAKIEIFTDQHHAEKIASTIMRAAHTGAEGDGMVAILPVDKLFRIKTMNEASPDEV